MVNTEATEGGTGRRRFELWLHFGDWTDEGTGRAGYLNYITPGILLMTVAAAVQGTAIVVAMDMTGGIIDRFRTMAVARSAVLTGHVLASLTQTLLGIGVVLGAAVARGFRPQAGVLDWLAAIGLLTVFAFALIWLATALGLAAKSVETASNTPVFLTLLPFLAAASCSSPQCRPDSASSPTTSPSPPRPKPCADPHRNPDRRHAPIAVAWSLAIASYLWARHLYTHKSSA